MKKLLLILIVFSKSVCFGQDYLLQKYTTGGNDEIYAQRNMVVDNNGNIYAAGTYRGNFEIQDSVLTNAGIYLAKFDNDLTLLWLKRVVRIVNPPTSYAGLKMMIDIDSNGNSVIAYSSGWGGGNNLEYDDSIYITSLSTSNVELIKLDSSGTRLWRKSVAGSNKLGDKGLVVDGQNNILITGKNGNDDVFITKYDENGNEIWYNTAGVTGSGKSNEGTAVTTDSDNNIYAAGKLYHYASADTAYFGSYQIVFPVPCFSPTYLAKYSPDGILQWVRYMYSSSGTINNEYGSSTITALECLEDGTIAVGGFFTNAELKFSNGILPINKNGNVGFRSSFLTRFDTDGNRLWAKTLHNTTNAGTNIVDLSIDNISSIYLLNEYWGTVVNELGDTILANSVSSYDMLLERFNTDGNLMSYTKIGCNYDDFAYDIVTYDNSVFTYSTDATHFSIGTDSVFLNYPIMSMVILKLTENPALRVQYHQPEHTIELFPNPNKGVFTVLTPKENSEVYIYNISGKLVYGTTIQNTKQFNVDIQNFPSGIYFFNLKSNDEVVFKRVVVLN